MTDLARPNRTLRRRIVIASLPVTAAVISIVAVTTGASSPADAHRATPLAPLVPLAKVSTAAPVAPDVLDPDGLGRLRLGMNRAQAMASGEIAKIDPYFNGGDCALIHLVGAPITSDSAVGWLSKRHGIVAIFPPAGVKTSEGIGLGSTIAAVKRAYPGTVYNDSTRQDRGPRAAIPGHPNVYYKLPDLGTGKVQQIGLVNVAQSCFD
jgi:hypothetical protein